MIRIRVQGAQETAGFLRRRRERLRRSPRSALGKISPRMEEAMRRNVHSQGEPIGASWPALDPATIRDRARKGFPPGPPLIRSGDLVSSIQTLTLDDFRIAVGSDHVAAGVLDRRFPFLGVSELDADEWVRILGDFYFSEE